MKVEHNWRLNPCEKWGNGGTLIWKNSTSPGVIGVLGSASYLRAAIATKY